jgi:electron transfer flavoprotein alpha/beta subunit
MRAFVAVKRVIDYAVKPRIAAGGKVVELANVVQSMNPFCEIAVEEAVRLKEKKVVGEIVAVSIGSKGAAETLRKALAMGADSAVHIETDMRTDQELQPLAVAKLLAWLTKERKPDFWILGKQVRAREGALHATPSARRACSPNTFTRTCTHACVDGSNIWRGHPSSRALPVARSTPLHMTRLS